MPKETSGNKPRSKVRVFFVEGESSDEGFLEAIKTLASAMRPVALPPPHNRIHPKQLSAAKDESVQPEADDSDEDVVEAEVEEFEEVTPESAASSSKKRYIPTPQILGDLDLNGFKEFAKEKKATNHFDRYIVIAAWLKEHQHIEEVSIDHIWTAYRRAEYGAAPMNMAATFRDAKSKTGYFKNGSKPGLWKIQHAGLNRVLNEMGKADKP